jgi:hypothetical protein
VGAPIDDGVDNTVRWLVKMVVPPTHHGLNTPCVPKYTPFEMNKSLKKISSQEKFD